MATPINIYACYCPKCRARQREAEQTLFRSIFTPEECREVAQRVSLDFPASRIMSFANSPLPGDAPYDWEQEDSCDA